MGVPLDSLTAEGYDMTFGTNVIGQLTCRRTRSILTIETAGHFYFTELLIPALYKASTPSNKSRVVNVTSQMGILGGSPFGSGLDFSTFKDSPNRRKMSDYKLYGQSKLVSRRMGPNS